MSMKTETVPSKNVHYPFDGLSLSAPAIAAIRTSDQRLRGLRDEEVVESLKRTLKMNIRIVDSMTVKESNES